MTLNDLILLAALLLLAGCCLLPRLGDLPRTRRARQFWMPAAALLYSVLALRFLDPAAGLIVSLFGRFPSLAGFPLTMLLPVLSGMVLLILYLPVKLILTRTLSGLFCRCRPLYEAVAGRFYEKSEDYEGEFLRDRWGQLRSLLRGLQLALILLTVTALGISIRLQLFSAYRFPLCPVLATLILGEIVSFLSGLMLSEYEEQVLGMGENARRTGSFARLRKIYRELFADRLLCDESSERQPDMESGSSLVQQLQQSGDPEEQALGGYFDRLLSSGVRLDETRMLSSRDLLQGRSVLYADPFYRDLTPYLVFVFCRTLVRGGRLLVVTGRPESAPETAQWLTEALGEASGAPTLWQVGPLSPDPELDVGVLSAAQLYDRELQSRCEEFLQQVRFVLLVEPSRLTAAGQIGLRLLLSRCGGEEKPVYAACDRNQDGLVDALSHLLEVSLTEVVSTDMPACSVTSMFWQADGEQLHHRILEGVARCLGTGTELAAVALKNQVEQVRWFGSSRAPLLDLRWLAGQYARPICDYTGVYPSQHWLEEAIRFCPDLWGQKKEKRIFAVVEDEFDNLFEMSRQFATRGEEQAFLHILSGRYLLRDYMCANQELLSADPKAIPSMTADYAATPRNTAVRLLMLLEEQPVRESRILRELGEEGGEGSTLERLKRLIGRYFPLEQYPGAIRYEERDELSGDGVPYFFLGSGEFRSEVSSLLRPARWVSEKEGEEPLDSRLLCHTWQTCLPGQLHTFSGKYYEILSVSRERGVLVRRAADHFTGRRYYRQLRQYVLSSFEEQEGTGSFRSVSGLELRRLTADIRVSTAGYLDMERLDDICASRKVLTAGIPDRFYHRRELLAIRLPEAHAAVRLTVAVLLRELFVTAFPGSHDYLAVVTDTAAFPELPDGLIYGLEGGADETIYVLEDSPVDLGLMVAVERNLIRFLEQICDFCLWHEQQLRRTPGGSRPQTAVPFPAFEYGDEPGRKPGKSGKSGKSGGLLHWLRQRLRPGKKEEDEGGDAGTDAAAPSDGGEASGSADGGEPLALPAPEEEPAQPTEPVNRPDPDGKENKRMLSEAPAPRDGEPGAPDDQLDGEDSGAEPAPTGYAASHYLLYGFHQMPDGLDPHGVWWYLSQFGLDHNLLREAREGGRAGGSSFDGSGHCCDFCGAPLSGAEYDVLSDGRERCVNCRRTAVDSVEEFQKLYQFTRQNMETLYGIHIKAGIRVRVTNAREIARRRGKAFHPTAALTQRAVGVAIADRSGYTLLVENGAPRVDVAATIVHELTHIWQYQNWDYRELRQIWAALPRSAAGQVRREVEEGMAVWAEIQYLYLIRETARAERMEALRAREQNEYGRGLLRYRQQYPFARDGVLDETPFRAGSSPLPPILPDEE